MIDVDGLIASIDKTQFVCPPPANLTAAGTTCADWQTVAAQNQIDGFKAKKEEKVGCKVNAETVDEDAAESAADAATLVKHNADGSSIWRVGGWVLKVNKERTPVAILEPETDKVLFKIKSVTEFNAGVLNTHFKVGFMVTTDAVAREERVD